MDDFNHQDMYFITQTKDNYSFDQVQDEIFNEHDIVIAIVMIIIIHMEQMIMNLDQVNSVIMKIIMVEDIVHMLIMLVIHLG